MQKKTDNNYDLEDRTFLFAQSIRSFLRKIKTSSLLVSDMQQLMRSSGSIGANYIEANDAISRKDLIHRVRICKKEAKETIYWLKLLVVSDDLKTEKERLIQEANELMRIFATIIKKLDS